MKHPRTRNHVPPLLRGIGLLLVLLTSLVVGVMEHREDTKTRARMALAKAHADAIAAVSLNNREVDSVAREIRLLRLQLQEEDFVDKVFENLWFQLLGVIGSALVAVSFLYEARAKWPRRRGPEPSPPP